MDFDYWIELFLLEIMISKRDSLVNKISLLIKIPLQFFSQHLRIIFKRDEVGYPKPKLKPVTE